MTEPTVLTELTVADVEAEMLLTAHVAGVSVSGSRPTAREMAEVATADAEAVTL